MKPIPGHRAPSTLAEIGKRLRLDGDAKSLRPADTSELRADAKGGLRVKTSTAFFASRSARNNHRESAREQILTGLRASLQSFASEKDESLLFSLVSVMTRDVGFPEKGKGHVTVGHLRDLIDHTNRMQVLRTTVPALSTHLAHELALFPSTDAGRTLLRDHPSETPGLMRSAAKAIVRNFLLPVPEAYMDAVVQLDRGLFESPGSRVAKTTAAERSPVTIHSTNASLVSHTTPLTSQSLATLGATGGGHTVSNKNASAVQTALERVERTVPKLSEKKRELLVSASAEKYPRLLEAVGLTTLERVARSLAFDPLLDPVQALDRLGIRDAT